MAIEHYAILAEVSYANFNNVKNLKDGNLIKAELSGSRSGLSESQINSFVENYEVIKHISQPSNGYAGTIVKNKKSGELFVLHKGTENFQDWLEDAGLVVGGLPYRQLVEAKKFVDDNVKNGVLKTGFTNIGHSLGKSISDLVHFTTDRSKGVVGFNGAGSRFSDGSSPIHFNPALTTKILMEQGNRAILVGLAKQNGNAFNDKKSNVINIVSGGPSVVASSIPYDQHGKIIYMHNGSIGNHYIAPFLEPMEYVHKLSEAYKLSLEKSIEMYNIVQRYAYTFEPGKIMPRQDQSKVYSLVNEFIANNKFITASQVELFAKKSYLDNQKNAYSKINFSQYRYWPDYGAKAQNRLDITPSSHLQTKEIKDADYFDSTKHYKIALNREMLNEQTSAFAVSLSNIATDNFRVANFNLSKNALDTPNYSSRLGANFGSQLQKYTSLNWFSGVGRSRLPVDPLVLDLNGDGAKVVGYNEKPVLFDIDNDGGSLEETGWLSSADGLLVKDLNNNGKIDNMAEVFSEFYAGKAGKGGESGQKRFRNGFEALKTLDANKDKQFNSKDKEFGLVRVWQDANHNGITDANELKTLASLGITAIDLNYQEKGGQLFGGNELLASGSFIRTVKNKAQKQEVIAVNFLANPRGHTITNVNGGKKTVTEGSGLISGSSSFTAEDNKNRDLNAQTLGVLNIQAGNGNDILRGDAKDNWLAGNGGKDTFFGGDGNDVLLIDGDDLPDNINGGKGDDIVQVIGDKAVSLDLGKAEVEVAHGGRGDDTFISSGNSSIFVRGGDGNDILWGSIANDALSGENGEDFISGNSGKDVIRGHRGNDRLFGDEGDDILFGGSDDDTLHGGSGNDTLLGEGGDDYLDGSDGEDVAEYSGNFADYKMTQMGDGVLISDKTQGRDGTDFLRNIEKLNFKDITNYGISSVQPQWENPVPVEDILYQDSNGQRFDGSRPYIIKRSLLLNNDIDPQGDPLRMNKIYNIRGGTLRVLTNSDLEFTPDKNFKGIASFEYGIEDIKKNSAQQTVGKGELRGKVYLVPPSLPTDPDIIRQYYLDADNILPVWNNYIGRNIRIGQFEPSGPFSVAEEVADYRHPELRHKMDKQWLHDYEYKRHEDDKVFSKHATEVAGIMVAERNGEGGIGVAHGATVASHWVGADISSLTKMKNYDVVNHSWGHTRNFSRQLEFTGNTTLFDLYKPTLTEGRKGLGTVIVNSAGNERANGGNSNYSELTNARYAIAVAAAEQNSSFETKIASYSNPGASILVAAHGSNAYSSSREVVNDNGSVLGQQYAQNSGTSFSAPVVSGVVALMLEANPYLGYRDVQEILALTATTKGVTDGRWQRNGAKNWNGGGMHINHDYGYGVIDAQAAVRLAQDWHSQHTYYNEVKLENAYKSANVNRAIGEGIEGGVDILRTAMQIENVSVKVNLTHSRASDLVIKLISPSGVESILMNRPGKNDSKTHGDVKFANSNILDYTFNTTLLKGESPNGHWKLQVLDVETGATGTLNHWSISFYGRTYDGSDTYVYTDEFHNTQAITTLNDNNGGNDTINAAAMNGVINVNLSTGKANLAGRALTIANPQQIENVTGGDYNDSLTGNNASNILVGGRGNDTLVGLDGHDFLAGGLGNNTLTGNQGNDSFIIEKKANSQDIVVDFVVGTDSLVFTGFSAFNWTKQQQGKDTLISLENGQTVRLNNVQANLLTNNHIVVTSEVFKPYWFTQTAFYGFANRNAESVLPHLDTAFWGTEGEDRLFGGNGNDVLRGGKGNDIIVGEHSSDTVHGGNDILYGGDSDDRIFGGGGNDTLYGGTGSDALFGGFGNDIIYLEGDDTALSPTYRNQQNAAIGQYTNVELSWAGAQGGKGSDRFIVVKDTSSNASKGLLKNLILDFDINDKNEKIDLSQFKGLSDLYFESFVVNNELYTRIWLGAAPKADTQYITLKGISFEQLKGKDIFITSQEDPTELPRLQQALTGVATNDVIKGNAVGNFIDGRAGADTMSGEFGDDTYIVDNVGDKVVEVIDGGYDVVKSSVSYTLSNYVEELQLTGKAAINAIGNNENNRLVGNSGNNQLDGKSGFDTMLGYEGNDTYIVDSHLDKVIEKVNHGIDNVSSSVSYTLPENVEHLVLVGNSSISATGNSAHNSMKGNAGNNRLIGYDGNDTLNGMQGKDFLMGGKGNDTYQFNRGDGIDNIYDEQGSDTLRFTNVNHNQLWLRKLNTDLEVSVIGTSDKVIITDWYGKNYKVENITAANNKTLSHANVDKLVSAMAGFAPPAGGQISLPQAINTALTPVLTANWK